ncbi:MAG: DUF5683 domain-containing protein [candidate division KSB1 bacterium]|nr:DUF5683 domain-containing protein [candidate division KSB1 bacterium]MDZ7272479.1 DUF5683 domain-containing protein [candidate division KSB1 bacterium]MDZ7284497.1 DUF5683 domain-containing protein [candidate division KSB1 bacterium]MDZ7297107.1 DUF5683 domain-containing protein [candidate division KSB1 bacterium]MDZ7306555.1 DUF5683 domain-containing protein [candidate division KSB1 bacterium]
MSSSKSVAWVFCLVGAFVAATRAQSAADATALSMLEFPLTAWCQAARQDLVWSSHTPGLSLQALFQDGKPAVARRSVVRAAILSAVLPGAGQIYNRSYLKSLLFLGMEAGAWGAYAKFTRSGNRKTDAFERFADQHWSEGRYWDSIDRAFGCSPGDRACERQKERENFSHYLPDSKNQTYYENIGKYDQFNAGWDDSISGEILQRDSQNRLLYTTMRREANEQFHKATLSSSLAMVNHLVSMAEAAFAAHKFNQTQARGASIGMRLQKHHEELLPVLAVQMLW